jgi:Superinfection immunity protein
MTALLLVGLAALYFAPAITAFRRECKSSAAIFVFNLVFGWTVFGWLIALAWALGGRIRGSIWPTEVLAHVRIIERTPGTQ